MCFRTAAIFPLTESSSNSGGSSSSSVTSSQEQIIQRRRIHPPSPELPGDNRPDVRRPEDLRDRPALRRQPQFPPEPTGARRRTSYARWSMKNALSLNSSSCWPASTATFPASNSSSCLSRPPALPLAADELQDERRRATSSVGAYTTTLARSTFSC